jgi:hypothetical protein
LTRNGSIGKFVRQKLLRKLAAQLEIFGFVHHAHAAATELLQNAIVGDGLADH